MIWHFFKWLILAQPPLKQSSVIERELSHDDVIKWKHFPRYWPFVREIHRPPVNSPHKGQWLGTLMFPLICIWINGWLNNGEAGDLRRFRFHYDVTVMLRLCYSETYPVAPCYVHCLFSVMVTLQFTDTGAIRPKKYHNKPKYNKPCAYLLWHIVFVFFPALCYGNRLEILI